MYSETLKHLQKTCIAANFASRDNPNRLPEHCKDLHQHINDRSHECPRPGALSGQCTCLLPVESERKYQPRGIDAHYINTYAPTFDVKPKSELLRRSGITVIDREGYEWEREHNAKYGAYTTQDNALERHEFSRPLHANEIAKPEEVQSQLDALRDAPSLRHNDFLGAWEELTTMSRKKALIQAELHLRGRSYELEDEAELERHHIQLQRKSWKETKCNPFDPAHREMMAAGLDTGLAGFNSAQYHAMHGQTGGVEEMVDSQDVDSERVEAKTKQLLGLMESIKRRSATDEPTQSQRAPERDRSCWGD